MLSKRRNRKHQFEALLGSLPPGCILDGEVVALDEAGRPQFADLMFRRRPPIFVAFDVLVARGQDVRALPLARRKAVLKRLAKGHPAMDRPRMACPAKCVDCSNWSPPWTSRHRGE